MSFYDQLKFDANGLIPAIVQEQKTGRVLMMAWMNRASLEKTLATGRTHFWSRSRQKFWMKGETSGHVQEVRDIAFDCDGDVLLIQVAQTGAANPVTINPANAHSDLTPEEVRAVCIWTDLEAVRDTDALVLMRGWERSIGARAEVYLARSLNHPIFDAVTCEMLTIE